MNKKDQNNLNVWFGVTGYDDDIVRKYYLIEFKPGFLTLKMPKPMINFTTEDNVSFKLEHDHPITKQSCVIRVMIENTTQDFDEPSVPLGVSGVGFQRVLDWLHHRGSEENQQGGLTAWERDYLLSLDVDDLADLTRTANFLDIEKLLHAATTIIAERMRGRYPEEIREMFGIQNDFMRYEN